MLVINPSLDRISLISYTECPDFLSEIILSCMKSEACLLLGPYCGFTKNSTFPFWKLLTRDWKVDKEYPALFAASFLVNDSRKYALRASYRFCAGSFGFLKYSIGLNSSSLFICIDYGTYNI